MGFTQISGNAPCGFSLLRAKISQSNHRQIRIAGHLWPQSVAELATLGNRVLINANAHSSDSPIGNRACQGCIAKDFKANKCLNL